MPAGQARNLVANPMRLCSRMTRRSFSKCGQASRSRHGHGNGNRAQSSTVRSKVLAFVLTCFFRHQRPRMNLSHGPCQAHVSPYELYFVPIPSRNRSSTRCLRRSCSLGNRRRLGTETRREVRGMEQSLPYKMSNSPSVMTAGHLRSSNQ